MHSHPIREYARQRAGVTVGQGLTVSPAWIIAMNRVSRNALPIAGRLAACAATAPREGLLR